MSKYTTELRFICEQLSGESESQLGDKVDSVIKKARSKIFNFSYPIFDEAYRSVIETKILKHFYFKEIGFETYGMWHMYLDTTMNEIMPFYNQLYESEKLKFNPFEDTSYTVEKTGNVNKNAHQNDKGSWNGSHDYVIDDVGNSKTVTTNNGHTEENGSIADEGTNHSTTHVTNNDNTETSDTGTVDHVITRTSQDKTTGTDWVYRHDTPQGSVTNLNESKYLTSAEKNTKDDTVAGTGNENDTETRNLTGTSSSNGGSDTEVNGTNGNTRTITDSTDETFNGNVVGDVTNNRTDKGTDGGDSSNDMFRTDDSKESWVEKVLGKRFNQSYSSLLKEFRETFLNIDMMVIDDLESLFMQLW